MPGAKHWTKTEVSRLIRAKQKGLPMSKIAIAVGRSVDSCEKKLARLDKDLFRAERPPIQKHSMCWLCQRAGNCDKPVDGWQVRQKNIISNDNHHRMRKTLTVVERCPAFIAEEWVKSMSQRERSFYWGDDAD